MYQQTLQIIKEIKQELFKVSLFQSLINALIIFLISYIILMPFKVQWFIAFTPAVLWGIINLIYFIKKRNLEYVESLFPLINEQLRTAKDNLDKDNEITRRLHQDVMEKAKRIKTSFFINFKALNLSILIIVILTSGIFFSSYLTINKIDFNEFNFKNPLDTLKKITSDTSGSGSGEEGKDDIFGKTWEQEY